MINKKRLVKTFTDLVKIDSESRSEANVEKYIKNKLNNLGIKFIIDKSAVSWISMHGFFVVLFCSD